MQVIVISIIEHMTNLLQASDFLLAVGQTCYTGKQSRLVSCSLAQAVYVSWVVIASGKLINSWK